MSLSFRSEEDQPGWVCIKIEGNLTIQDAAELKACLLETLEKAQSVRIDLDASQEIDLSCLQLFCAAHKSAMSRGKAFSLDHRPQHLKDVMNFAGFSRSSGCALDTSAPCLWIERRCL